MQALMQARLQNRHAVEPLNNLTHTPLETLQ